MAIDNLALAGNLVFDVDEASLVPSKHGYILVRYLGDSLATGTAINGLKFQILHQRTYKCIKYHDNLQMKIQAYHL